MYLEIFNPVGGDLQPVDQQFISGVLLASAIISGSTSFNKENEG